jgi:hypothetical protein
MKIHRHYQNDIIEADVIEDDGIEIQYYKNNNGYNMNSQVFEIIESNELRFERIQNSLYICETKDDENG